MKKFNTLSVFGRECNNLLLYPCIRALGRRTPVGLSNSGPYFFRNFGLQTDTMVRNLISMSYSGYVPCNGPVILSIAEHGLGYGVPIPLLVGIVFWAGFVYASITFPMHKLVALVKVFHQASQ